MAASRTLKNFVPLLDRVLVQRAEVVTKTKSGLLIPEKAAEKVREATVVAVGPGQIHPQTGQRVELNLKVGDVIMLPEFGGSKIELDNAEFTMYREQDIAAKFAV